MSVVTWAGEHTLTVSPLDQTGLTREAPSLNASVSFSTTGSLASGTFITTTSGAVAGT